MSPMLADWIAAATRGLAARSAAQVRTEIEEHYEAAREDALVRGESEQQADRTAVRALGDPYVSNRHYRAVMLTRSEARILGQGQSECRAVASRPWLLWALRALPLAPLGGMALAATFGDFGLALALFIGAVAIALILAPALTPIRTPAQGRLVRRLKWAWLAVALVAVSAGGNVALISSFYPGLSVFLWIEWVRARIRRKLPQSEWPRHLYV